MILCVRREACGASEGAGLELLIRQLQGHPGVEHGGPQLAPHPVVGQAEDLGGKLSSGLGGQDGGAAQTCREKTEAHSGWRIHVERSGGGEACALHSPLGMRREDQTSCAPQSGVRGGQLMTG